MAQHLPDGRIAFLHRNLLKWDKSSTQTLTWKKIKKFRIKAAEKEYILYRDYNKKQDVINLVGDVDELDFRLLFPNLEESCFAYLQSLREKEFYKSYM